MSKYHHYGKFHGNCMAEDPDQPDADAFLDHMEAWLPEGAWEEYMEGFAEGRMG